MDTRHEDRGARSEDRGPSAAAHAPSRGGYGEISPKPRRGEGVRTGRRGSFDRGSGDAIIVIPGLQGRWEWMRPALDALSQRCRTISYSLCSTRGTPAEAFDRFLTQVDEVLDRRGLRAAAICGVSFGGLIALRYAATRPDRTTALILVSTPPPSWRPSAIQARYLSQPWRSTPAFVASSPVRLWPEVVAALPDWSARVKFCTSHLVRMAAAPVIPARMAQRIQLREALDLHADCARIVAPTMVVTGEPGLDQVVPPEATREFVALIKGARYKVFDRTGHLGVITQPERFARLVSEFVHASHS
jgi:3-oxoadipate enol-lactonase